MRCSNCGKDIPFGGNVCPFCGVDKKHDQTTHSNRVVAGCAVGVIIAVVAPMCGADIGTTIFIALIGMVIAQVVVAMTTKEPAQRIAPTIQRTAETPIGDTKKCPYCAEDIKKEALKCRFCGSDLNK